MLVSFVAKRRRSSNQWLLTDEGWQALQHLLKQVYPQSYGPTDLEGLIEIRRDTIYRVLPSGGKNPKPVQLRTLEAFFEKLNEEIKSQFSQGQKSSCSSINNKRIQQELTQLLRPFEQKIYCYRYEIDEVASTPSTVSDGVTADQNANLLPTDASPETENSSVAAKVSKRLWLLDYFDQEKVFSTEINCFSQNRSALFLIQTKAPEIQRWLLKRLARQVPNYSNAERFCFDARSHSMRWDFASFWADFAKRLNTDNEPDAVITALREKCQSKLVLISISSIWKEGLSERLFKEFLTRLVTDVNSQSYAAPRAGLVLFLTEDASLCSEFECLNSPITQLPSLEEIQASDITGWLCRDDVYDLLKSLISEEHINQTIQTKICSWSKAPKDVVEEICCLFRLQYGLAEVEPFWRWD